MLVQKEKVPWYEGEGHPNPLPCPQNPQPFVLSPALTPRCVFCHPQHRAGW